MSRLAVVLIACAIGCGSQQTFTAPAPLPIAGTYEGTLSNGTVTWALRQDSTRVTGDGVFVSATDQSSTAYALRGAVTYDSLTVRLVGAPGDSDADSVSYRGAFDHELYHGIAVTGFISGPSTVLYGPLTLYLRGTQ